MYEVQGPNADTAPLQCVLTSDLGSRSDLNYWRASPCSTLQHHFTKRKCRVLPTLCLQMNPGVPRRVSVSMLSSYRWSASLIADKYNNSAKSGCLTAFLWYPFPWYLGVVTQGMGEGERTLPTYWALFSACPPTTHTHYQGEGQGACGHHSETGPTPIPSPSCVCLNNLLDFSEPPWFVTLPYRLGNGKEHHTWVSNMPSWKREWTSLVVPSLCAGSTKAAPTPLDF